MPRVRKLTLKDAEKRLQADNPAAWAAATPAERAEAVALLNAHLAQPEKPDMEAFIRRTLAPPGGRKR